MNELILKITNIAVNYPNQLSKFYAVSKVNDKIDWKLFTQAIQEYLEFNKHSSSPIISVFKEVSNEVNLHFGRIFYFIDYNGIFSEKLNELAKKENIELTFVTDNFEIKSESRMVKVWKWILDLVG
jgi:hypothetical protein